MTHKYDTRDQQGLTRFTRWLWALTSQSLDFNQPDPKFFSRKSYNMVYVAVAEEASSLPASGSPPMRLIWEDEDLCSERVVNSKVVEAALQRWPNPPSLMLELLASARMACRRHDGRRAIIDIGTAVEAALTDLLNLPANHGKTLGTLVNQAGRVGKALPADTNEALVQARNDAAHRGRAPSRASLCRALEIAEETVSQVDPALIPVGSLQAVHRPQRQDLLIIKSPDPEP